MKKGQTERSVLFILLSGKLKIDRVVEGDKAAVTVDGLLDTGKKRRSDRLFYGNMVGVGAKQSGIFGGGKP